MLSTQSFTGAEQGASYGLEASPRARTPLPGLYLAGQDVVSDGVVGALSGSVFAAQALHFVGHLTGGLDVRMLPAPGVRLARGWAERLAY